MFEWLPINFGQFSYFHLLRPWWLLALIPLLVPLSFLLKANNPVEQWRRIIDPALLKAMVVRHGQSSRFNPVTVAVFVVLLGVIAMAGPTWKQQPSPFSEDIAALIIALDVSSSMQQQDVQPSRLERAKLKVKDLLALRPGGRVGLIVFAGSAHSVIPLTNDPEVIKNFLDAIEPEIMPRKGKFPEQVLPIAEQMLGNSPVPGTVLLIGDGVSPKTAAVFEQYFSVRQHQLLLLGVGRDSVAGEGRNNTGALRVPLERAALEKLASENNGYYQTLTFNKDDVRNLNRRIDSHLVIVEDGSRPWVDEGYYLVFVMGLCMLLWFRRGWTLHWCVALVMVASMTAPQSAIADDDASSEWAWAKPLMDLWLTPNQQGRYYLQRGDYKKAAVRFESIAWRGVAYYRDQNFAAATEMFSRIESVDGYFNQANAWAHSRNYVYAVQAYNQVLKLDPKHPSALKNRDQIQSIIDQINLLSASQKAEDGDSSRELGDEQPLTADGAERQDFVTREVEQLSAEDILLNQQINDQWMRQVQKDPSFFLGVKFQMQLRQGKTDE
ncbi:MAG: VWA domain-containing protein [Motiliproteus sp.]